MSVDSRARGPLEPSSPARGRRHCPLTNRPLLASTARTPRAFQDDPRRRARDFSLSTSRRRPSGDVDTVAAMAGAMVGAAVGMSGLDVRLQAWSACLNGRDTFRRNDLVALAHQLK